MALAQIKSLALQAKQQEMETKRRWGPQQQYLAPGGAVRPCPHRRLPQRLVTTLQMLEVTKEALLTMAGKAWRMTPWEWEEQWEAVEAMAWGVSQEAGVALGEAREAVRAPEAVLAQTERASRQRGEGAEKAPILHQYYHFWSGLKWTRGSCPTLDGDRRPYGRTLPGMSILQITIRTRAPGEMKESLAVEAPAGAKRHRQLPPRHLEAGVVGQAAQA